MRVVVCLDLEDDLHPVDAVVGLVRLSGARVDLLHVIDSGEHARIKAQGRTGLVRGRASAIERELERDERELLRATYERAADLLRAAGAADVALHVGEGRAEEVIVGFLSQTHADLCIVGRRPQWVSSDELGPRSVGRVARFVLDHASCPVVLLR
jgi:nucleotide-binding universal stress UspA family protein